MKSLIITVKIKDVRHSRLRGNDET